MAAPWIAAAVEQARTQLTDVLPSLVEIRAPQARVGDGLGGTVTAHAPVAIVEGRVTRLTDRELATLTETPAARARHRVTLSAEALPHAAILTTCQLVDLGTGRLFEVLTVNDGSQYAVQVTCLCVEVV